MAVAYPTNMKLPLVSGYSVMDGNRIARNDVMAGPPRFELISDNAPVQFTASWLFTSIQFQLFEGWFKHDLNFGAKAFNINLLVGAGLKQHECYFDGPYRAQPKGKLWIVKAKMIGVAKVYDALADYDKIKALVAIVDGDAEVWSDAFNIFIETTLPNALG